jgi:hypothetical protein
MRSGGFKSRFHRGCSCSCQKGELLWGSRLKLQVYLCDENQSSLGFCLAETSCYSNYQLWNCMHFLRQPLECLLLVLIEN